MEWYIARANVDHYISLLNGGELTAHHRSTITKLDSRLERLNANGRTGCW